MKRDFCILLFCVLKSNKGIFYDFADFFHICDKLPCDDIVNMQMAQLASTTSNPDIIVAFLYCFWMNSYSNSLQIFCIEFRPKSRLNLENSFITVMCVIGQVLK